MILPPDSIAAAAHALAAGELVALPTETVYGLAADALSPTAVARIFATKGRPADHPLIVHVADGASIERWVVAVPNPAKRLIAAFWPGPLTLVLPKSAAIPESVTGGQSTVALRSPRHAVTQQILRHFEQIGSGIIAAPSANRYGRVSPTSAQHVEAEFAGEVTVVDGGACPIGIESTIVTVDEHECVILRLGSISAVELQQVLGDSIVVKLADATSAVAPRVSGSHASHYAPTTPLALVAPEVFAQTIAAAVANGEDILAYGFHQPVNASGAIRFERAPLDPLAYARELYASLRGFDALGVNRIVVEAVPQTAAWAAIRDRLQRASTPAPAARPIANP
jgi:L-threonylcarbamoyladenylate synthase